MQNKAYWFFKYILIGPWLRVYNRPFTKGLEKLPKEGAGILASNHLAVMDSFYLPLVSKRQLTFLAKKEYFTTPGLVGGIRSSSSALSARCRSTARIRNPKTPPWAPP